ncbi:unnamed protein product, partial [Iphiclides podalirius]
MMAPDAENCEEVERLNGEEFQEVPVHQGRRVQPEEPPAVQAWTENEELERSGGDSRTNSPGENRRLLGHAKVPPAKAKSRLQAGLTLAVWGVPKENGKKKPTKGQLPGDTKETKTKFQKRREKLIAAFKPPYFILTMIVAIVCIHALGTEASARAVGVGPRGLVAKALAAAHVRLHPRQQRPPSSQRTRSLSCGLAP